MTIRYTTTLTLLALAAGGTWLTTASAVEGAGALGEATSRNGSMSGGAYVQPAPRTAQPSSRRAAPQAGPDTMPSYPRGTRRLGYDNDNDFSGANEVQRGAPNANPDRQQLENAFDD